jgi:hypothetical protein
MGVEGARIDMIPPPKHRPHTEGLILTAATIHKMADIEDATQYSRHEHDLADVAAAFNMAMRGRTFRE